MAEDVLDLGPAAPALSALNVYTPPPPRWGGGGGGGVRVSLLLLSIKGVAVKKVDGVAH